VITWEKFHKRGTNNYCGGRLDQPAGCPDAVYGVMHACWAQRPQERPSFATLAAWLRGIARGEDARPALPPPEERAARECVICMSEPRVVVARPCRHCSMCEWRRQCGEV